MPPPATGREVQRLSRAIDSMRRQIEGRPFVETFAADLSHELKNPVAAIRASAEVLADGALEEREEAARFVSRIQEATSRIEALLGDLLSLARIEARGVENAGRVDVASLVRDAARREREGGGTVSVTAPASAEVRGDASWIARAVENLVDNALRHGTPGEPVTVEVKREGAQVHVLVANAGEVDRHVAKRLFRRFVTTREGKGRHGVGAGDRSRHRGGALGLGDAGLGRSATGCIQGDAARGVSWRGRPTPRGLFHRAVVHKGLVPGGLSTCDKASQK